VRHEWRQWRLHTRGEQVVKGMQKELVIPDMRRTDCSAWSGFKNLIGRRAHLVRRLLLFGL